MEIATTPVTATAREIPAMVDVESRRWEGDDITMEGRQGQSEDKPVTLSIYPWCVGVEKFQATC